MELGKQKGWGKVKGKVEHVCCLEMRKEEGKGERGRTKKKESKENQQE